MTNLTDKEGEEVIDEAVRLLVILVDAPEIKSLRKDFEISRKGENNGGILCLTSMGLVEYYRGKYKKKVPIQKEQFREIAKDYQLTAIKMLKAYKEQEDRLY